MNEEEYRRMARLEDRLWWFGGLRGLVLVLLARHLASGRFALLDAGCGTGGMLARIAERWPEASLHGVDYAPSACEFTRSRTRAEVRTGSVNALPYADGAFDVVVSLDVLDADDVDPPRALAEFHRVLRPGGLLVLNLAAYQWLLSYHDRAVGQSRRFSLRGTRRLLAAARFRPVQGSYWNTLLFPLMVLRRKLWPGGGDGASDVREFPAPLNALFGACVALERRLVGGGLALPYGGSVICVAARD